MKFNLAVFILFNGLALAPNLAEAFSPSPGFDEFKVDALEGHYEIEKCHNFMLPFEKACSSSDAEISIDGVEFKSNGKRWIRRTVFLKLSGPGQTDKNLIRLAADHDPEFCGDDISCRASDPLNCWLTADDGVVKTVNCMGVSLGERQTITWSEEGGKVNLLFESLQPDLVGHIEFTLKRKR